MKGLFYIDIHPPRIVLWSKAVAEEAPFGADPKLRLGDEF